MRERGTLDATERTVPYDTDAEEAVLGALLLDPQAVNRVSTFLTAADFYRERNGWVYEAVIALADSARPVDVVTLGNELSRRDRLEAAGGLGYLSHLVSVVPTALHVEHYAEIVHRCALMRRLIAVGGQIAALGYQAGPDVDATLGRAEDLLYTLRREGAVRGFVHIREVLDQYLEESLQTADEEKPELEAVKTGFVDIDRLLGGLQRSDLVILAARPSLGKSSLALNIAHHAALRQKATVAIFSLEMSREQVAQRLLCSQAGVDSQRVRMGFQELSRAEQDRINEAVGVLAATPIYIDDTPLIRVSELRAKAKRLHAEVGVDLVVVDYLQLIAGNTPDNRVQEISEISRSLKGLAREIDVPVLALSQLSRAVEGRTPHVPMLSDLRDSGSIEQDADVVMFIYREDVYFNEEQWERQNTGRPYPKGIAQIIVGKHRNGPTGQVSLIFFERTTKFADLQLNRE